MGKHKKNLLLRNHKAQSFPILCVAMNSGPLYKSCQPYPWSKKWPARGSLAPIDLQWKKTLLFRNHKDHSFHILCVAMYSNLLNESCQPCPRGLYRPRPGGVMGKHKKNLLLRNYKAKSFHPLYVAVLFINPANHAPGVKNGPAPWVISSHRLTIRKKT